MKRPIIAPSILSADFSRLGEEINSVEVAGADWIHVDVMDGHFVPNLTIGPPVVSALRSHSTLPFDVHLMIANPERYIESFVTAGADWLVVHVEACIHLHRVIQQIRSVSAHPGIALNPGTHVCMVEPVLDDVDMVLIMSVNPGFGGQTFIPSMIPKIIHLRRIIDDRGLNVLIQVDGGVNEETVPLLAEAGADVYVAGTAVFSGGAYRKNIEKLRRAAMSGNRNVLTKVDPCDLELPK